jgi:hypothetical protein
MARFAFVLKQFRLEDEGLKPRNGQSIIVTAAMTCGAALLATTASAAPPDIQGEKIQNCAVITSPGFYRVTANLPAGGGLLDNGDCIQVGADDVTIDLAGFELSGIGIGSGITDDGTERQETTIRNGTITGFAAGIDFDTAPDGQQGTVVEEVRAIANGIGIRVGRSGIVRHSVVRDNTGVVGISVAGGGSVVAYNLVSDNGGIGIQADTGAVIIGNSSTFNTGDGISAGGATTVVDNTVVQNGGDGIAVSAAVQLAGSVVSGNTAFANTGDGIDVNSVGSVVSGNASSAMVAPAYLWSAPRMSSTTR